MDATTRCSPPPAQTEEGEGDGDGDGEAFVDPACVRADMDATVRDDAFAFRGPERTERAAGRGRASASVMWA
jgi:hypothetical protein